ncbi:mevalonate kinase [Sulfolobus acidocaldarius SUSAZ]|nr:mevalonate kinase [Sulfolobus acidocaldarius SUSAZ]
MIVEALVPLKLTLFGEHAVVYGRPAIAYTISEYLKIRIIESERFYVTSNTLELTGVKVDLHEYKVENENVKRVLAYITETINYFGAEKKVSIDIESPVDPSVGLGTSAGVVVGMVSAYSTLLGHKLSREQIAKISHEIELRVQGLASIMDTHTETFGGFILVKKGGKEVEKLDANMSFSSGYFRRMATTADMLKRVKKLKESKPQLFESVLNVIEQVTTEAKNAIVKNDEEELGELMYINHGLLFSIGITVPVIDQIVSTARIAGVKGCKVSGGGGGGAVVCTKSEQAEFLIKAMGGKLINANPSFNGVMIKLI